MTTRHLREKILALVDDYAKQTFVPQPFQPGTTPIPPSGKVIGAAELCHLVEAALDGWLTTGRFNDAFEQRLGSHLGVDHVLTTNSGSSANLLALSALTSPTLGSRRLQPGDEVLTVAASFPTTVNPIFNNGLIPVLVDVEIPTYNIDCTRIEAALSSRTRAIMIAHTLGNPFNLAEVVRLAKHHNLWLIEDCCDALDARYDGRHVGTFGDIATVSFFPAHHITTGEGGAVWTPSQQLYRILQSMRDWGRDCHCDPGHDNTCGRRFHFQMGGLPMGYDHKYIYSHLGYNLKMTDMQAAVGLAQMDRLHHFTQARKHNFALLRQGLDPLQEFLVLPTATPNSDPSWFGFPLTLTTASPHSRQELLTYLDIHHIGTRMLFSGNITRQPYFKDRPHRISGSLAVSDTIMNQTFWIGLYPGLSETMLSYVCDRMTAFFYPQK